MGMARGECRGSCEAMPPCRCVAVACEGILVAAAVAEAAEADVEMERAAAVAVALAPVEGCLDAADCEERGVVGCCRKAAKKVERKKGRCDGMVAVFGLIAGWSSMVMKTSRWPSGDDKSVCLS